MSTPSLFLSHGAPDLLLSGHPVLQQFQALSGSLPSPRAVVVVSAHWISQQARVTSATRLQTIHDFYGFPEELYQLRYPAQGDPQLAQQLCSLLREAGIDSELDPQRGLDHGAWVPLMALWPRPGFPVLQVSINGLDSASAVALGTALKPLREEGVLILCSGGSVHNLRAISPRGQTEPWASGFSDWLTRQVEQGSLAQLADLDSYPPEFATAHPTIEHYLPLLTAWAAGDPEQGGRRVTRGFQYANIGLDSFRFD